MQEDEAYRQAAKVKYFIMTVPFTSDDMEGATKPLSFVPRDAVYQNFEDEAFVTVSN